MEASEAAGGPDPVLQDRIRLSLTFDPARLAEDLARFGEGDWTRHAVKQNYEGDWRIVPLRAPAGETHPIRMVYPDPGCSHFVDTHFLDRAPYFRALLSLFPCPLRTARLMRLSAGSLIREHCDPGLDAAIGRVRLHIPITTNPLVEFLVNRRAVTMEAGSCWYLRLTDPHQVTNRGESDRVHLVIDSEMDAWLAAMLRAGAAC